MTDDTPKFIMPLSPDYASCLEDEYFCIESYLEQYEAFLDGIRFSKQEIPDILDGILCVVKDYKKEKEAQVRAERELYGKVDESL